MTETREMIRRSGMTDYDAGFAAGLAAWRNDWPTPAERERMPIRSPAYLAGWHDGFEKAIQKTIEENP